MSLNQRLSRRGLGFQLALTYSTLFFVGVVLVFIAFYLLLQSSLAKMEDQVIRAKLNEFVAVMDESIIRGEWNSNANIKHFDDFLIRRLDKDGKQTFIQIGRGKPARLTPLIESVKMPDDTNRHWQSVDIPGDEDILRIFSLRLGDGSIVQLGRRNNAIEGELEFFREKFLLLLLPTYLLGLVGGIYFSRQALRPIRELIRTTTAITSGDLSARVAVPPTNDELNELTILTNMMLSRIETLVGTLKDTLDNFAHDLRTPIARLRAAAETALQSNSPQKKEEALSECLEESNSILTLVNSLIELAASKSGSLPIHLKTSSLNEIIESVIDLHEMVATDKKIKITFLNSDVIEHPVDPDQLRRALSNLLENALKFTSEGGRIEFSVRRERSGVVIEISDSGVGITADQLPRIWERLYRINPSRSDKGLGLGLSIVKALVEAQGGTIQVSSREGHGSRFTIMFA